MGYKVCVYAICKNEEQFVDRWMDSMSEADLVVVTDTGSTDGTIERLRQRNAVVYEEIIQPWRFDTARNLSLSHVPDDFDICVCTDLDEVFCTGWRKKLEQAWQPDATMGNYLYNWSLKPDGSPDIQFNYFKIHTRLSYKWIHPVHECLCFRGKCGEKKIFLEGIVLNHYPDQTKPRSTYLPLLELAVKEEPFSDRMNYYLGREYYFKGMWQACIASLQHYLMLPTATWQEERSAAMRHIADSYYHLSNHIEAKRWYYRAIAEVPSMREPYIDCAKMGYALGDWPMVLAMTDAAFKIAQKSPVYINQGYAWDHTPDDLCAIACYNLNMYHKALYHAKSALSYHPSDERLMQNLNAIKNKLEEYTTEL